MDTLFRLLQIALIITQIYQSQQTSSSIPLLTSSTLSSLNTSPTYISVTSTFVDVSSDYSSALVTSPATSSQAQATSIQSSAHSSRNSQNTTLLPPVTTSTAFVTTSEGSVISVTSLVITPTSSPGKSNVSKSLSTGPGISTSQTSGSPVTSIELVSQTASLGTSTNSTQSTLQTSNVLVISTGSVSPRSNVPVASTEPASNGSTTPESTKAVSVSHSGSISHNMTANYSSSSATKPGSDAVTTFATRTKASSTVQSLTPSPVSLDWTDWSVDSDDCEKYCSEKGGTVTASRQCKSHSSTLANSVCSIHDNTTKVFECGEPHCPISGTEAFRSFISVVAVGILLTMLATFV